MKKLLALALISGSLLAQESVDIKIDIYELELAKYERYLKVSEKEYNSIMKSRVKELGLVNKVESKKINDEYGKLIFKHDDKIVAETIENNVVEVGIDYEKLNAFVKEHMRDKKLKKVPVVLQNGELKIVDENGNLK